MNDALAPVRVNQPLLFQQLRWRLLHNAVAALRRGASARLITICLCSLLVWGCVFAASWLGFDFLRLQNRYNTFVVVEDMIATFFDLFFLALALGLVFSGSIILYSIIRTHIDLHLHLHIHRPCNIIKYTWKYND